MADPKKLVAIMLVCVALSSCADEDKKAAYIAECRAAMAAAHSAQDSAAIGSLAPAATYEPCVKILGTRP